MNLFGEEWKPHRKKKTNEKETCCAAKTPRKGRKPQLSLNLS